MIKKETSNFLLKKDPTVSKRFEKKIQKLIKY